MKPFVHILPIRFNILHIITKKQFIGIVTIIMFLISPQFSKATNYYVADDGDDTDNGTTTSTPWKTIDKVNSMMGSFAPGDNIYFKRDDVFRGTLEINGVNGSNGSPITFGTWSTGSKPVIKGSEVITGWSQNGNIWTVNCPDCGDKVTSVFVNNSSQPLGRYPNKSYRTITGSIGQTTVIDDDLSYPDGHWNNAEVVIRVNRWIIDAMPILSQTGTTMALNGETTYGISAGWGYFIQNHVNALDTIGEWAYDKSTKDLHYYSTTDVNSKIVEVSEHDYCIDIESSSYININDIEFTQSNLISIYVNNSNHCTFDQNDVTYSGGDGILVNESDYIDFTNNNISNTNNKGLELYYSDNCEITDNIIKRTAIIPGRGYNGNQQYLGVKIWHSLNTLVEYNLVDSVGYIGIGFYYSDNTKIRYNKVTYTCLVKDDGGGIYTWKSQEPGIELIGNIVNYSIGAPEGTNDYELNPAHGIYIDDNSIGVRVEDNICAYNSRMGIFNHSSDSLIIKNNMCFENGAYAIGFVQRSGDLLIDGNEITGNVMYSSIFAGNMEMKYIKGSNYFENNYLFNSVKDKIVEYYISGGGGSGTYTFEEWASIYGNNTKKIPITFAQSGLPTLDDFVYFQINDTKSTLDVNLTDSYRDKDNNLVTGNISIEPFSSIILFKEAREILGAEATPTGPDVLCQDGANSDYTTTGSAQASTYQWYVSPESAGSFSGSGTTGTINWNASFSGDASIFFAAEGAGDYKAISLEFDVYVSPLPSKPQRPQGSSLILQDDTITMYAINEANNADSYLWQLSNNDAGTIISGSNNDTVTVQWDADFVGRFGINVKSVNSCGESAFSDSLIIEKTKYTEVLGDASTPSGNQSFCQGTDSTMYSFPSVYNALEYDWDISPASAGTITDPEDSATYILWNTSFSGDAVLSYLVTGKDFIAKSPDLTVHIKAIPNAPDSIFGETYLTQDPDDKVYYIIDLPDITSYTWDITDPLAGTISSVGNVATIYWEDSYLGNIGIFVNAMNECGLSENSDTLFIEIGSPKLTFGVSNVFTPNDDGINDFWEIPFIHEYPEATIKVFKRDGTLVADYTSSDEPWNGRDLDDIPVPMGNYFYIIDLKNGTKLMKGYIAIIK